MGASFGASRELVFLHEASGRTFSFPQNNGDIFAFTSTANSAFMHGIPKTSARIGQRFSIIAWGKRRTINERNGSKEEIRKSAASSPSAQPTPSLRSSREGTSSQPPHRVATPPPEESEGSSDGTTQEKEAAEEPKESEKPQQKKAGRGRGRGGRLQGGIWGGGGKTDGRGQGRGRGGGRGRGS